MCGLDINVDALKSLSTDNRAAMLHAFVDKVHAIAQDTRAAVHAFVGDALIATWNAVSTCAQPEAKAARFAARVRAACARGEPLDAVGITGGVVCGAASCLMAGLGDQRAHLVSLVPTVAAALTTSRMCAASRDAILAPAFFAHSAQYAAVTDSSERHRVAALQEDIGRIVGTRHDDVDLAEPSASTRLGALV